MAFAVIAGLPVEIGLYTALIPMMIYALLGTSKNLSVSTTTTIAILSAVEISMVAPGAATNELIMVAITLAFMVGAFLILASFLRLGFLANFISAPVLTGFKAGIAVVIIVDQLPKLLGIHIAQGNFIQNLLSIAHHLPATNLATLVLAVITLIIIFGSEYFFPRLPAAFFAIILGIAGAFMLGFHLHGIKLVGAIPAGLPSFSGIKFSLLEKLWPGALGIALMSFTESIAAGKAFLAHDDEEPNPNRELFALGAANLIGSFFQSMPAGGGTSQTVVNSHAGAKSQASEIITALFAILVLLFLTPMVSKLPYASLAAVVVAMTVVLLNPAEFYAILKIRKIEFFWAIAALVGVILFGVLNGVLFAVAVSILTLMYKANHPPLYVLGRKKGTIDVFRQFETHPDDEIFPGLLILRTEGALTFASAPNIKDKFNRLIAEYSPKVILIDLSAVPNIEYTALLMLANAEEKLQERGVELQLSSLNPQVLDVIRRSDLGKKLGTNRMFFNIELAIDAYARQSSN